MHKAFMIKAAQINLLVHTQSGPSSIKAELEVKSRLMFKKMINIKINHIMFKMISTESIKKFSN